MSISKDMESLLDCHQEIAITNENELEFALFCVENVADRLGMKGNEVYEILTEQSDILDQYIVANYETLHTQSKEYIVEDIIEYMKEEGLIK